MLALAVGVLAITASAPASPTTQGTWTLYPAQTFSETSTTTTGTAYKTVVRPPINADGSSNWPAKRGVIPVQFDLLAASSTTVTTTKTWNPPVFESIYGNASTDDDFSYLSFQPTSTTMRFSDITDLTADYAFTLGDCHGGSLRWSVRVDGDGDGVNDGAPTDPAVFIYYGAYPEFGNSGMNGCTPTSVAGEDSSAHNMLAADRTDDLRFDTSQFAGGTFYDSYANALTLTGGSRVLNATLALDSGWQGPPAGSGNQRLTLTSAKVNDNTWVPNTGTETSSTTTTGTYAKTCDLPDAEMHWTKADPYPDGALNEAESIQPKDTGLYYRKVDCKYIYNLDVTSLSGQGTYRVYAKINGAVISDPGKFDLK
jgi:hypothetical protein